MTTTTAPASPATLRRQVAPRLQLGQYHAKKLVITGQWLTSQPPEMIKLIYQAAVDAGYEIEAR